MTDQDIYELLQSVAKGNKTPEHAFDRIVMDRRNGRSEIRLLFGWSIAVIILLTVLAVGCFQSAI